MLALTSRGTRRKTTIRRLIIDGKNLSSSGQDVPLIKSLDDKYVRGIPFDTYVSITHMAPFHFVERDIVKVTSCEELSLSDKPCPHYMVTEYGTELGVTELGISFHIDRPYQRTIALCRIIEYKVLEELDAPLLINWFWLSDTLKKRLFKM